ncbi:MAG: hypothetical protein GW886_03825 [Rhodobacterales bacterium]|nr:hypothetical protein [Rhodobacterales bacterium]NCT12666.1 hypothetical protein [Rhodobacterales bacterium]
MLCRQTTLAALLCATALTAAPVQAVETDPLPAFSDLLAPNRLATFLANLAIAGLRTEMEVQYDHMSTDIMRGTVSISGVTLRPTLNYDQAGQCTITIDRVTMSSDFAAPFEAQSELTLDLVGAQATLTCLEREAALMLRSAGFNEINLDQARAQVGYVYATGETALDATLAVNGLATLDFSGAATILPHYDPYRYTREPAYRVSRAVLSLKDAGGWAAFSTMLPANLRDPEAVRQMGTEFIMQELMSLDANGVSRAPGAVERNFVNALMDKVAAFVADPGEITIEANLPAGGILVEPDMYADAGSLIAALALEARTAPRARAQIIDSATLAGLVDGDISDAQRVALAAALLDGLGVPRAPALVPDLLAPVIAAGGADAGAASALLSRAIEDSDPAAAYAAALAAGASGGGIAQLDRLEARMTTQTVLAAQAAYVAQPGNVVTLDSIAGDDPRALRKAALAHMTGSGAARSYAQAYYLVLLAEAAGDVGAPTLRASIEARFAGRGDEVAALWRDVAAQAQTRALNDWIETGLANRYFRN